MEIITNYEIVVLLHEDMYDGIGLAWYLVCDKKAWLMFNG